jgi:hypothetical protein
LPNHITSGGLEGQDSSNARYSKSKRISDAIADKFAATLGLFIFF